MRIQLRKRHSLPLLGTNGPGKASTPSLLKKSRSSSSAKVENGAVMEEVEEETEEVEEVAVRTEPEPAAPKILVRVESVTTQEDSTTVPLTSSLSSCSKGQQAIPSSPEKEDTADINGAGGESNNDDLDQIIHKLDQQRSTDAVSCDKSLGISTAPPEEESLTTRVAKVLMEREKQEEVVQESRDSASMTSSNPGARAGGVASPTTIVSDGGNSQQSSRGIQYIHPSEIVSSLSMSTAGTPSTSSGSSETGLRRGRDATPRVAVEDLSFFIHNRSLGWAFFQNPYDYITLSNDEDEDDEESENDDDAENGDGENSILFTTVTTSPMQEHEKSPSVIGEENTAASQPSDRSPGDQVFSVSTGNVGLASRMSSTRKSVTKSSLARSAMWPSVPAEDISMACSPMGALWSPFADSRLRGDDQPEAKAPRTTKDCRDTPEKDVGDDSPTRLAKVDEETAVDDVFENVAVEDDDADAPDPGEHPSAIASAAVHEPRPSDREKEVKAPVREQMEDDSCSDNGTTSSMSLSSLLTETKEDGCRAAPPDPEGWFECLPETKEEVLQSKCIQTAAPRRVVFKLPEHMPLVCSSDQNLSPESVIAPAFETADCMQPDQQEDAAVSHPTKQHDDKGYQDFDGSNSQPGPQATTRLRASIDFSSLSGFWTSFLELRSKKSREPEDVSKGCAPRFVPRQAETPVDEEDEENTYFSGSYGGDGDALADIMNMIEISLEEATTNRSVSKRKTGRRLGRRYFGMKPRRQPAAKQETRQAHTDEEHLQRKKCRIPLPYSRISLLDQSSASSRSAFDRVPSRKVEESSTAASMTSSAPSKRRRRRRRRLFQSFRRGGSEKNISGDSPTAVDGLRSPITAHEKNVLRSISLTDELGMISSDYTAASEDLDSDGLIYVPRSQNVNKAAAYFPTGSSGARSSAKTQMAAASRRQRIAAEHSKRCLQQKQFAHQMAYYEQDGGDEEDYDWRLVATATKEGRPITPSELRKDQHEAVLHQHQQKVHQQQWQRANREQRRRRRLGDTVRRRNDDEGDEEPPRHVHFAQSVLVGTFVEVNAAGTGDARHKTQKRTRFCSQLVSHAEEAPCSNHHGSSSSANHGIGTGSCFTAVSTQT